MRLAAAALICTGLAWSQPTVAPTREPTESARGEDTREYNVRQSFELGYRWRTVGGSLDAYRGMVNFGNGVRLLASSLSVNSLEGSGRWFDQIQLNTQGLGNDPYQSALFRVEKNRFYRYDLNWRSTLYSNPGLYLQMQPDAFGRHHLDTVRNTQDHDVTFLPQAPLRLFLGFSRNTQRGPAVSSVQLFDSRGDEFPLFADVQRRQHEYRTGFELRLFGWRLNLLHGWVNFKEDPPVLLSPASAGRNLNDATSLASLRRTEPYHGNSPYWRIALFRETRRWAFNGRFTHVSGRRAFVLDETAVGTNRFGAAASNQIVTLGRAQRPATAASATFSFFPSGKLTLTNQTSLHNIRMVGNAAITVMTTGGAFTFAPFSYLAIRTVSNAGDADYRPVNWFGLRAGYQYSSRRIRSIEDFGGGASPVEQTNGLHTGVVGIRIRPLKPLTINLDGETGRADRPIYPVSSRKLHALRGRIEFRRGGLRLAGYARSDYSTNSASLANFASRSRQYGADGTWTILPGASLEAGYAKMHLDTLGALNYFAAPGGTTQLFSGGRSYYVSNLHTAWAAARFGIGSRVDVALGFNHVQDAGDGRVAAAVPPSQVVIQTAIIGPQTGFFAAQTFPLRFTSPQGRVSVRIREKLRWNAGYQRYQYAEEFGIRQNFRAHTGYSSVSWSF